MRLYHSWISPKYFQCISNENQADSCETAVLCRNSSPRLYERKHWIFRRTKNWWNSICTVTSLVILHLDFVSGWSNAVFVKVNVFFVFFFFIALMNRCISVLVLCGPNYQFGHIKKKKKNFMPLLERYLTWENCSGKKTPELYSEWNSTWLLW